LITLLTSGAWQHVRAQAGNAVAVCDEVQGVLLAASEASWRPVKAGSEIAAGTQLCALFEAVLAPKNRNVEVRLLGDVGEHGPLPVMEAAVTMRESAKADCEFDLLRGVVVLTNQKKLGPVRVRVVVQGEPLEVTLQEPGSRVAMELYGRHAPGAARLKEDNPAIFLLAFVSKGAVMLAHSDKSVMLKAPPGPALFQWDSVFKQPAVEFVKDAGAMVRSAEEKKRFARMSAAAGRLPDQAALAGLLRSADPLERKVGVTALGATDDLAGLFAALGDEKHADVRDHAVVVLRHWLGRSPGQVKRLHQGLTARKLSDTQAMSLLQLIVGFDGQERQQPQTYGLLIDYLKHEKLPVRHLAHWHLVRLVPEGRKIAYDPAAPPAQREQGYDRWRKFIPAGSLPPAAKTSQALP
jgi:hypothetical protein